MTTPTNPKPPTDTLRRVFRGGSRAYYATASDVRAAFRVFITPSVRDVSIGFRTAQTGCRQPLKGTPPP